MCAQLHGRFGGWTGVAELETYGRGTVAGEWRLPYNVYENALSGNVGDGDGPLSRHGRMFGRLSGYLAFVIGNDYVMCPRLK